MLPEPLAVALIVGEALEALIHPDEVHQWAI